MDHLCYLCLVFVLLLSLFVAALWSPVGKGLSSWLLFQGGQSRDLPHFVYGLYEPEIGHHR